MKTTIALLVFLKAICPASGADAQPTGVQVYRGGSPISPEVLAKIDRIQDLLLKARDLVNSQKLGDAIKILTEAVAIERTLSGNASGARYELAQAKVSAGDVSEALKIYKSMLTWDARRQDWTVNGPSTCRVAMDYAMAAAQHGDKELAKQMYYFGLRSFNLFGEWEIEPLPFLVVFDPEPGMDAWDYTSDKLAAAAFMVKAGSAGGNPEMMMRASALVPEWQLPKAWAALYRGDRNGIDEVMRSADTRLKAQLAEASENRKSQMAGLQKRKASKVINSQKPPTAE